MHPQVNHVASVCYQLTVAQQTQPLYHTATNLMPCQGMQRFLDNWQLEMGLLEVPVY